MNRQNKKSAIDQSEIEKKAALEAAKALGEYFRANPKASLLESVPLRGMS